MSNFMKEMSKENLELQQAREDIRSCEWRSCRGSKHFDRWDNYSSAAAGDRQHIKTSTEVRTYNVVYDKIKKFVAVDRS